MNRNKVGHAQGLKRVVRPQTVSMIAFMPKDWRVLFSTRGHQDAQTDPVCNSICDY